MNETTKKTVITLIKGLFALLGVAILILAAGQGIAHVITWKFQVVATMKGTFVMGLFCSVPVGALTMGVAATYLETR